LALLFEDKLKQFNEDLIKQADQNLNKKVITITKSPIHQLVCVDIYADPDRSRHFHPKPRCFAVCGAPTTICMAALPLRVWLHYVLGQ
jgi:hypothetical protein